MAKKSNKNMTITINPDEIIGSEIMRSGDYRYARLGVRRGDSEYLSISYEWKGEGSVPEFVMGLMEFIKANEETIVRDEEEYAKLKERV